MSDSEFVFTDEMIRAALRANGWRDLWHPDNWVHESHTNPDWSGDTPINCFKKLLSKNNLI